jgi:hypothetical protein
LAVSDFSARRNAPQNLGGAGLTFFHDVNANPDHDDPFLVWHSWTLKGMRWTVAREKLLESLLADH